MKNYIYIAWIMSMMTLAKVYAPNSEHGSAFNPVEENQDDNHSWFNSEIFDKLYRNNTGSNFSDLNSDDSDNLEGLYDDAKSSRTIQNKSNNIDFKKKVAELVEGIKAHDPNFTFTLPPERITNRGAEKIITTMTTALKRLNDPNYIAENPNHERQNILNTLDLNLPALKQNAIEDAEKMEKRANAARKKFHKEHTDMRARQLADATKNLNAQRRSNEAEDIYATKNLNNQRKSYDAEDMRARQLKNDADNINYWKE
jgi:hypothetical protein